MERLRLNQGVRTLSLSIIRLERERHNPSFLHHGRRHLGATSFATYLSIMQGLLHCLPALLVPYPTVFPKLGRFRAIQKSLDPWTGRDSAVCNFLPVLLLGCVAAHCQLPCSVFLILGLALSALLAISFISDIAIGKSTLHCDWVSTLQSKH